jgi:peptidoglycan/LPS O-acetylase OafA/YrhL
MMNSGHFQLVRYSRIALVGCLLAVLSRGTVFRQGGSVGAYVSTYLADLLLLTLVILLLWRVSKWRNGQDFEALLTLVMVVLFAYVGSGNATGFTGEVGTLLLTVTILALIWFYLSGLFQGGESNR